MTESEGNTRKFGHLDPSSSDEVIESKNKLECFNGVTQVESLYVKIDLWEQSASHHSEINGITGRVSSRMFESLWNTMYVDAWYSELIKIALRRKVWALLLNSALPRWTMQAASSSKWRASAPSDKAVDSELIPRRSIGKLLTVMEKSKQGVCFFDLDRTFVARLRGNDLSLSNVFGLRKKWKIVSYSQTKGHSIVIEEICKYVLQQTIHVKALVGPKCHSTGDMLVIEYKSVMNELERTRTSCVGVGWIWKVKMLGKCLIPDRWFHKTHKGWMYLKWLFISEWGIWEIRRHDWRQAQGNTFWLTGYERLWQIVVHIVLEC